MKDIIPFKSREVKHCPPHFIKVPVEIIEKDMTAGLAALGVWAKEKDVKTLIRNWLHENCENRFYIGKHINSLSGFSVESFLVSFENPADATYFTLLLPNFTEKK